MSTATELKQPKQEIKSAYWSKEYMVKEVQTSSENLVRFSLCHKNGRIWLSIREWYKTRTGEFAPGKHGMAVPVSDDPTVLVEMMSALEEAYADKEVQTYVK